MAVQAALLTPDRLAVRVAAVRHKAVINLEVVLFLGKAITAVVLLTRPRTMVLAVVAVRGLPVKMAQVQKVGMAVMGHRQA